MEWNWRHCKKNCKITITEEFIQRLKVINPQITIIGKYRGNSINIACKCKICGCEWEAKPYHLLNGTGCRKCSGKDRTHNEFLELFKKKGNTSIDLIGSILMLRLKYYVSVKMWSWMVVATRTHFRRKRLFLL